MISISSAESQVMDVLWEASPRSAEEVVLQLQPQTQWHEKTIKTLLNRLLRKGAIRASRDGRRYLYSACLTREAYQRDESRSFVERVFGGKVTPLLAQFSRHEELSDEDIAELRALLDALESKGSRDA